MAQNTQRVLGKLQEEREMLVCDQETQCVLPVINTLAVQQLANLGVFEVQLQNHTICEPEHVKAVIASESHHNKKNLVFLPDKLGFSKNSYFLQIIGVTLGKINWFFFQKNWIFLR